MSVKPAPRVSTVSVAVKIVCGEVRVMGESFGILQTQNPLIPAKAGISGHDNDALMRL
jgi:hypothetical protein